MCFIDQEKEKEIVVLLALFDRWLRVSHSYR